MLLGGSMIVVACGAGSLADAGAGDGNQTVVVDAAVVVDAGAGDGNQTVVVEAGHSVSEEDATDVVMSGHNACVLGRNGGVRCFEHNLKPIALPADLAPASQIIMTRGRSGHPVLLVALRQGGYRIIGLYAPDDATAWDLSRFPAAAQMAAGDSHACAIDGSGRTWCVGRNDAGQLGTSVDQLRAATTAKELVGWGGPVLFLAAGGFSTCAIVGGTIRCAGQFGTPATGAVTDLPLLVGATRLSMGGSEGVSTACGLVGDQGKCTHVSFPAISITDIAASDRSACGLTPSGEVICAGEQYDYHAMQYVDATPRGDVRFRSLRGPSSLYCGIARDEARVYCWGAIDGGWTSIPVALP